MIEMDCQQCHSARARIGYNGPQLCYLCWCLATGAAPEDIAEALAVSEADYERLVAEYRTLLVPQILAAGGGPYYAAKGYAWASAPAGGGAGG